MNTMPKSSILTTGANKSSYLGLKLIVRLEGSTKVERGAKDSYTKNNIFVSILLYRKNNNE